jgi:hypothetical protein
VESFATFTSRSVAPSPSAVTAALPSLACVLLFFLFHCVEPDVLRSLWSVCRSLLCGLPNTLVSPSVSRPYSGRTVALVAPAASVTGEEVFVHLSYPETQSSRNRIVRAFLVEEAAIVKKVLKGQQKGGKK